MAAPRTAPTRARASIAALIILTLAMSSAHALPKSVSKTMPRDPNAITRWAWEPTNTTGPDGSIWVAANRCNAVDREGVCTGTPDVSGSAPVWRSTDGGRTYRFVGDALRVNPDPAVARAGGASVDIAVAQLPRGGNPALVSVLSSTVSSSMLAISADNGATWRVSLMPSVTLKDRPSIASVFACDLFIATRATSGSLTRVERYDACQIYDGSQAIARAQTVSIASGTADPATRGVSYTAGIATGRGIVYIASLVCSNPASAACDGADDRETARVAISRNRGASFTETTLPATTLRAPLSTASPISIDADDAGNVVVAAWDGAHIKLWRSRDDGATWRLARTSPDAPLKWQFVEAPSVAIAGNDVSVSWFGSPKTTAAMRAWYLGVARSIDGGATFTTSSFATPLATRARADHLGTTLRDGIASTIAGNGSVALAYTQSCDGHPVSDATCPSSSDEHVADLVVRYGWIA